MAVVTPALPTLQGIPPELRNKIYDNLLTEPRHVSGRKLLELRRRSPSGEFWKQFQSAAVTNPLIMTCRQMRTEFSPILATTARQSYRLVVNNLDLEQIALFHSFFATYCFSHRISDKNIPPLLFKEVMLCLKLDGEILPSVEAYCRAARVEARLGYSTITSTLSEVTILPRANSSVHENSTSKSKSMSKAQAKLARGTLRRTCDGHELYEPDQRVMRLLVTHLTEMVDNHWPTTSDEIGETWRSLKPEATQDNAPRSNYAQRLNNAPRFNNAPRSNKSNNSTDSEVGIGMKVLPALLFIVVVGLLSW